MTPVRRSSLVPLLAIGLSALLISGCGSAAGPVEATPSVEPTSRPTPTPTSGDAQSAASDAGIPTVPGYPVGEFPPVPLIMLPDLALLDSSESALTINLETTFADIPGVTATPARCDESGSIISGNGSVFLYGDSSGSYTGPDGIVRNFGNGSGTSVIAGVTIQNFGDGSGSYVGHGTNIRILGDGSGSYVGHGTNIQNFGDGSGSYVGGGLNIRNLGDGTGAVNGIPVRVDPLPPVPKLGSFPPLAALAPLTSCGTTLTFDSAVLFDFDKSDIRPDASAALDEVANAFAALNIRRAEVSGHTDAIGSDSYNQTLSERRASAVVSALKDRGVTANLTSQGFGKTRPVAPNEIDGTDNPAGRQLNRRVEIFIPSTL